MPLTLDDVKQALKQGKKVTYLSSQNVYLCNHSKYGVRIDCLSGSKYSRLASFQAEHKDALNMTIGG